MTVGKYSEISNDHSGLVKAIGMSEGITAIALKAFLLLNVCHSYYTTEVSIRDLPVFKMIKLGLTVNLKCIRTPTPWNKPWLWCNKFI